MIFLIENMNIPHAFFISLIEPYFILHRKLQIYSKKIKYKQAECQNLTAHSKGSKTLHTDNRNMKTQVPLVASTDVSIGERTNVRYESFLQR